MVKRFAVIITILLVSGIFPQFSYGADRSKAWIAGKIYDVDKTTPLEGVPLRIVNVESGKVTDEKSQEEGCYRFKDVKTGTYSLAATYKGVDYLLPEKVIVELLKKKDVAVSICVALSDKDNSLILLENNCHVCLGAGFPPLGIFLLGGTSAIAGGVIIKKGGGDEPVVSESRP